jgi:hypothetical protein
VNVGVAAGVVPEETELVYVQLRIFCVAVYPPVPPVKPTYAVLPPTVAGMLIAVEAVKLAVVT